MKFLLLGVSIFAAFSYTHASCNADDVKKCLMSFMEKSTSNRDQKDMYCKLARDFMSCVREASSDCDEQVIEQIEMAKTQIEKMGCKINVEILFSTTQNIQMRSTSPQPTVSKEQGLDTGVLSRRIFSGLAVGLNAQIISILFPGLVLSLIMLKYI